MNKFKLDNRYNANIWLEHIENDLWELKSSNPEDLSFMRIIYEEDDKSIYAIDPSGGPFLSIGTKLKDNDEEYVITEISPNGYILRLTQNDHK